jgi:ERCC4-type nuclease
MTPFEVRNALEGMVVLCDTREQNTPRLRARLRQIGVPVEREKLDFGDYSAKFPLPAGGWFSLADKVAIERKMDIDELAHCFCQGRRRFAAEFQRAKDAKAKMYLIVEDANFEKAYAGHYRTNIKPAALLASIFAWLARYECQLLFCRTLTTGAMIRDILYREGKERLENGRLD